MKTITKLLSVMIIGMGVTGTSFANSPFLPSGEDFGGTFFDPFGDRQCSYEIYCNKITGEVGIDPDHVIIERMGSAVSSNGWSGYKFSNKIQYWKTLKRNSNEENSAKSKKTNPHN